MVQFVKTFRSQVISIFQSAASDFARQIDAEQSAQSPNRKRGFSVGQRYDARSFMDAVAEIGERGSGGPLAPSIDIRSRAHTTDRAFTIDSAKTCAALGLQYLEALVAADDSAKNRLKGQLIASTCDPRWAKTLEDYHAYFGFGGLGSKKIPYVRPSTVKTNVIPIEPDSRIALVADWGTGAQPAIEVLRGISHRKPDILIHLGDVYYSGTKAEYELNFINIVESELKSKNPSLAVYLLAGNHDMYCGGEGFYYAIEKLNSGAAKQLSSYFCLRCSDDSWQLLAMDTGLHDFSPYAVGDVLTYLESDEQEWIVQRIKEFRGRTILLSHHQLFSAFSQIGPKDADGHLNSTNPHLFASFQAFKQAGTISAWFWGHEHSLGIYEPYLGLARGRCVGHGAVPVFETDNPYEVLSNLANSPSIVNGTELSKSNGLYSHGYATITLRTDALPIADYFEIREGESRKVYSEEIE